MDPKPEIIAPTGEEIVALGQTCQYHWKQVFYNTAVFLRKIGNAMGGERVEADHVFGRCMGERSDGKTFFASVILPWIWPDDYDWKKIARARLDSFLLPECECDAREEDTKVCKFHLGMMHDWDLMDRGSLERSIPRARSLPAPSEGGGVYPTTKMMHKDYPWCREAPDGRYMCTICGFGRGQGEAIGNPTYRNIFIRDHSHCGFGDPRAYEPKPPQRPIDLAGGVVIEAAKVVPGTLRILPGDIVISENPKRGPYDATHSCKNCKRGVYFAAGVWWHAGFLSRLCEISGTRYAEAA